jgi:hypothetical protein
MNTKYSKVNGIGVKDETVEPNENGDEDANDVNNMSEADRIKIKKNTKMLKSFLKASRKVNGSLPENGSLKINRNSVIRQSFDFSPVHDSTFDVNRGMNEAKNVCLIEESPFYIHKV